VEFLHRYFGNPGQRRRERRARVGLKWKERDAFPLFSQTWAKTSEVENGWINDFRVKAEKPYNAPFKRDRRWEKS